LLEGLNRAKDTINAKTWSLIPRFRPFVEIHVAALFDGKSGLLAHPYLAKRCPIDITKTVCSCAWAGKAGGMNLKWIKWHEGWYGICSFWAILF